jgi:hypothetical protein
MKTVSNILSDLEWVRKSVQVTRLRKHKSNKLTLFVDVVDLNHTPDEQLNVHQRIDCSEMEVSSGKLVFAAAFDE